MDLYARQQKKKKKNGEQAGMKKSRLFTLSAKLGRLQPQINQNWSANFSSSLLCTDFASLQTPCWQFPKLRRQSRGNDLSRSIRSEKINVTASLPTELPGELTENEENEESKVRTFADFFVFSFFPLSLSLSLSFRFISSRWLLARVTRLRYRFLMEMANRVLTFERNAA